MSHQNVRAPIAVAERPPSFLWPSQAHLTPARCGHCNARLLRNDIPTAERPLVDLDCLMCSRTACELKLESSIRPVPPPISFEDEQRRGRKSAAAVANDDCANCKTGKRWAGRRLCRECVAEENRGKTCTRCEQRPRLLHRRICHRCRQASIGRLR